MVNSERRSLLSAMLMTAMLALSGCGEDAADGDAATPEEWHLVEEWRVGGEASGPLSFDYATQIEVLPSGEIVSDDYKASELHLIDRDGRPVATFGRDGGGPGEFSMPNGFIVDHSGNVRVNDRGNNRITTFDRNGRLVETRLMPGSRMSFGDGWLAAAIDDGRLVEVMPTFARPEMAYMQVVWDSTLARADTTSAHSCDGGMNGPAGDWYVALHARDSGRLLRYIEIPIAIPEEPVALDNHGYRWQADPAAPDRILKRKLNECEVVATIVLEGEPPMIDAGVAMAIGRDLRRGTEGFGAAVPELKSLPERHSWYRAIRVAQDDTVWVERMLSTAPFRRRVEIYESDGKQLAWLSPPTGLTLSRRSAITGDRVYGLMSDQDGIRYLAAFRIEKSPPPRELDEDSDGPALVGALSEVGRPGAVEMKQYNWRLPSALVEPSLQ